VKLILHILILNFRCDLTNNWC